MDNHAFVLLTLLIQDNMDKQEENISPYNKT